MAELTAEQIAYVIQFQHPERVLARLPGINNDNLLAAIFGIEVGQYRSIKADFARQAREAAAELLADPIFAAQVDRLPFRPGSTVVGLGDSITDDYQSWLEILRYLLELRRPQDDLKVINAGVSADTTSQVIARFVFVTLEQPDWVICMIGTNDARLHGQAPTKTLVSPHETEKNLAMLHNFARTQTSARWVWLTPATVIGEQIAAHWFLGPLQLMWKNEDLVAVAEAVKRQTDPVVDLQQHFGIPARPDLLLDDGLHPSLAGQKVIVKALVERMAL